MSIYQYPKTSKKFKVSRVVEMSGGNIAKRWRQLSGQQRWQGLLDPLDVDLRQYLIHYGQLAQATYDTFIAEKFSKHSGNSRFPMKNMFSNVGLEKKNPFKYKTVKYLYATSKVEVPQSFIMKPENKEPWNKDTNWIGYIAVADNDAVEGLGRRDIAVAWRGTIQPQEWVKDFDFPLISASEVLGIDKPARVHQGFLSVYTSSNPQSEYSKSSAREQVFQGLKELVDEYEDGEISITVTGHSLGAALASLNAADIVANGINRGDRNATKGCPVTAFVYACPRTGDLGFKKACDTMEDLRILRIRNEPDIVPKVPPLEAGYTEVGQELVVDTRKSTYLKFPGDFVSWHNLEVYLLGIAGTQGKSAEFRLECNRDICLVNKQLDALNNKYQVPAGWWREQHSGMTQQEDGTWKLHNYDIDQDDDAS